jgi:ferritin-like protein
MRTTVAAETSSVRAQLEVAAMHHPSRPRTPDAAHLLLRAEVAIAPRTLFVIRGERLVTVDAR